MKFLTLQGSDPVSQKQGWGDDRWLQGSLLTEFVCHPSNKATSWAFHTSLHSSEPSPACQHGKQECWRKDGMMHSISTPWGTHLVPEGPLGTSLSPCSCSPVTSKWESSAWKTCWVHCKPLLGSLFLGITKAGNWSKQLSIKHVFLLTVSLLSTETDCLVMAKSSSHATCEWKWAGWLL